MFSDSGAQLKLILQCDGASRGNPGPAAYGAVVLDAERNLIAELFAEIGEQTNNFAEYSAVIAGLEYVTNNFSVSELVIEMDSKLVIEQLAGRWKINSPALRELHSRAFTLLSGVSYQLTWIPRELNAHADAAANKALDGKGISDQSSPLASAQPRSVRAKRQFVEPTTIVLLRHGHTAHTEANLISGSSGEDPDLSELGLLEAKRAADTVKPLLNHFGLPPISKIYHSPQKRALQTAKAVAARYDLDMVADARLREIGFGAWEGVFMDTLAALDPKEVETWRGSMSAKPPGGESVNELELRVGEALSEIIQGNKGASIALVAHMMPCRAVAKKATQAAVSAHWSLQFAPASISIFRFFGTDYAETFTMNYCAHLLEQ